MSYCDDCIHKPVCYRTDSVSPSYADKCGDFKSEVVQEYESRALIEELSKMPPMVIATAYLHAINYTLYGEDVTEKWMTATQNTSALGKAYRKGYYDALQRQEEGNDKKL